MVAQSSSRARQRATRRDGLQLREAQLNRIQVWAVLREKTERRADGLNGCAHRRTPMHRQIVQHDDVARAQRRCEHLFDVGEEAHAIDRTVEDGGGREAGHAQGGENGRMDSYRVEKRAVQQILLPDENAEIEPVPPIGGGHVPVPERLSSILREFNDLFGAIAWQDTDRVKEMITETIPFRVAQDAAFKNARQNSDQDNARIEHGKVLTRVMTALIKDDAELFKQFMDNDSFKRWMTETRVHLGL